MTKQINRLLLQRVYLVGPMDYDREAGRDWRIEMSNWLIDRGAIPLDPYNKPVHVLHLDGLENNDNHQLRVDAINNEDWATVRKLMKPIVSIDLRMVDHSDFIICNLDIEKRPCGTYDEIFMAAGENKPVIIMCPQGKKNISPWLYGRLPYELFFDNWGDVKDYLSHIDSDEQIDTLDKWKFFDIEDIVRKIINRDD